MSDRPNRSAAVMQQRSEPRGSLDDFPTPPWATRAVIRWLQERGLAQSLGSVREPCANRGYMVRPLSEFFSSVDALDVHDYGLGYRVEDYLFGLDQAPVDWTFANPPFKLAAEFLERALRTSRVGVAIFCRSAFTESEGRYHSLFAERPPTIDLQHSERVVILRGRLIRANEVDPYSKKEGTKASTATAYSWLIWLKESPFVLPAGCSVRGWIEPCRLALERPGDYLEYGRFYG